MVGEAKGFVFLESDIGSIVNLGDINVGVTEEVGSNYHGVLIDKHGNVISDSPAQKTGETINLVGGLIINTGSLNTPGGTINIVSIPDKQLVQVTPEGSLLSLALPTESETMLREGVEAKGLTPLALPKLLTGGDAVEATEVAIVDGVITLRGSQTGLSPDPGTIIVTGNLNTANDIGDGGNINIQGEKVSLSHMKVKASGVNVDGGNINIQGEKIGINHTLIDVSDVPGDRDVANDIGDGKNINIRGEKVDIIESTLDASGTNIDGGNIDIQGEKVSISQSTIDASGINGGLINITSEGEGIEEFSDSSRILIDRDNVITAAATEDSIANADISQEGKGGTVSIRSNGAIAFATISPDFFSKSAMGFSTIDVSGINSNGTVEIKAKNNIATINSDRALDFYLDDLPSYLNLNAIDTLILESNSIEIIGENSDLGENAVVKEEINSNNFLTTENIPIETTIIPVDDLTKVNNLIIEASQSLVFASDTLVATESDSEMINNPPKFIGAIIEPENIDADQRAPLEDIPLFSNLTLRVTPPESKKGSLNIQGSFAVTNELVLENTNGDIIINPQLPESIKFTRDGTTTDLALGEDLEYRGSNGGLFLGFESIVLGVKPNGDDRKNVGLANINAPQGSVEFRRGIALNADSDLNITAQRLIASGTTTFQGNLSRGEPGRDDSGTSIDFTIGVLYFGGESRDSAGQPIFDEAGNIQLNEGSVRDLKPTVKLNFSGNSESIIFAGDDNTDAIAEININLLPDQSVVVGELDPENGNGITSIERFSTISTNGSIIGDHHSLTPVPNPVPPPLNLVPPPPNPKPKIILELGCAVNSNLECETDPQKEPELISNPDSQVKSKITSQPESEIITDTEEPKNISQSEPERVSSSETEVVPELESDVISDSTEIIPELETIPELESEIAPEPEVVSELKTRVIAESETEDVPELEDLALVPEETEETFTWIPIVALLLIIAISYFILRKLSAIAKKDIGIEIKPSFNPKVLKVNNFSQMDTDVALKIETHSVKHKMYLKDRDHLVNHSEVKIKNN